MTTTDHADPSVLEEPTIPEVGLDTPAAWDPSWAQHLTYDLIDDFARIMIEDEERFRQHCAEYKLPYQRETPTHLRTGVWLLKVMGKRGMIPTKTWLCWNAVCTIALSDWIWDRVEEHGVKIDRSEYEKRLKGAKK